MLLTYWSKDSRELLENPHIHIIGNRGKRRFLSKNNIVHDVNPHYERVQAVMIIWSSKNQEFKKVVLCCCTRSAFSWIIIWSSLLPKPKSAWLGRTLLSLEPTYILWLIACFFCSRMRLFCAVSCRVGASISPLPDPRSGGMSFCTSLGMLYSLGNCESKVLITCRNCCLIHFRERWPENEDYIEYSASSPIRSRCLSASLMVWRT